MSSNNKNDRWDAQHYKKHSDNQFLMGVKIINSIQFRGDETVLDVGCGDGRLTVEIAKRIPQGKILGIDISENMIQEAQKSFGDLAHVSFECIDATKFDIKNEFDVVVSLSAFHWIEDQAKALENIYAALKSGGRLFISMPSSGKNAVSFGMESDKWRNLLQGRKAHFQAQSPETIKPLLEKCGFVNIDAHKTTNERVYKTQKELCDWLMGWIPHATGLVGDQAQEFAQDVAQAAKRDDGNFVLAGFRLEVMAQKPLIADVVKNYYSKGGEAERLSSGQWKVEKARTESILSRFLPSTPATIIDVGGGAGAYALPLAKQGYDVYLIDLVPLHIEQAKEAEKQQPSYPLKACMVGDARKIDLPNSMADAVLLLGPLYHLPDKNDRLKTISEAFRILKPGGLLFGVGISRYASFMNGIIYGMLKDPDFVNIVKEGMLTGHHRNPTDKIEYFTTAYYHQPEELKNEFTASGFKDVNVLGVEGPGWLMPHFDSEWENKETKKTLLDFLEIMEKEPNLLGVSAHIMAIGKK